MNHPFNLIARVDRQVPYLRMKKSAIFAQNKFREKFDPVTLVVCFVALLAFKNNNKKTDNDLPASNPFSSTSALPYHTAPFDK